MEITIVKSPSLFRDILVMTLEENFPNFSLKAYEYASLDKLTKNENISDLIIVDIDTDVNLNNLIKSYKSLYKKVIIWTNRLYEPSIINLFRHNLDGYLYNSMDGAEIVLAIKKVIDGDRYIHHELATILFNDYLQFINYKLERPINLLTEREWQVFELITKGYKNEDIAKKLFLADKTVKHHVSSILKKLEVRDRTNAVIKAFKNRWFF